MRGESARPGKRPLRALSASEKMDAIQRVHEGESKASVARDIGVPESTLRGWCKSEHKIRGMARNSSTPDSEAHSPASSSGANPLISNLSSEDEGMGGPSSKKMKLELGAGCSLNDNSESNEAKLEAAAAAKQPKMDYVSSIINSLMAGGVRSENSSILLQQLGLLTSAQSAASLTKNLLNLSGAALGSAHLGTSGSSSAQAVGLVENGLQYSKSSVGNHSSGKRHSASSAAAHISAIAPSSQLDSVSKSRKSLPPAAEAPSTPVPASPRKTNDQHNGSAMGMNLTSRSSSKQSKDNGSSGTARNKADETFWLWLAQQQQLMGHQAAAFNSSANGVDGSWFWQWYKQCSFPPVVSPTPLGPTQQQQQQQTTTTPASRKSPSKAKALLDNVLCNNNNNNENVRRSLNLSGEEDAEPTAANDDETLIPTEEAIEHADIFFKWLDKCSEPSVTRLQIMQFKYLLDNLKTCRKKTTGLKQSRK